MIERGHAKIDGFIILLIDKYGWGALIGGIVLYLVIEGGLDIATDLLSDSILRRRKAKRDGE
jgi:hypothetical protein